MPSRSGEITYEIKSQIGVLATYQTGWNKELNLISWNGNQPKFDIRDWNEEHTQMSRGITLHTEEAKALMELLIDRFTA